MTSTTPDGLLFSLGGLFKGLGHDLTILRHSEWEEVLPSKLLMHDNQFNNYSDTAFMLRPYMITPFDQGTTDVAELDLNAKLLAVFVSVE